MVLFVVLSVSALLGAAYAYVLWRSEVKRQAWRQQSRAAWSRS